MFQSSAFPNSALISRHRRAARIKDADFSLRCSSLLLRFNIQDFCRLSKLEIASLTTPCWPTDPASEHKLLDISTSNQLSQSRERLLVRHAACFSSKSCWINWRWNTLTTFSRQHSSHSFLMFWKSSPHFSQNSGRIEVYSAKNL